MTQQYESLREVVKIEECKEDKEFCVRYHRVHMVFKVLICVILIETIIALFVAPSRMWFGLLTAGIWVVLDILFLGVYNTKKLSRLTSQCRPEKYLSVCMTEASKCKARGKWEELFYNIAMGHIYLGEDEVAEKVLELYPQYCKGGNGDIYHAVLKMRMAYGRTDGELFRQWRDQLQKLQGTAKVDLATKNLCNQALDLENVLELQLQGNYQERYQDLLEVPERESNLDQVIRNYNLYRVAKKLGFTEEAEQYKAVVLEKGGTTFYKQELSGSE